MPAKHQPDLIYLRYVPLWKVHIFTLVQLSCLVLLWVIKASAAAVVFPIMVTTVFVFGLSLSLRLVCVVRDLHIYVFILSPGFGSGFYPKASGLLLHSERTELARRPDA